MFLGPQILIVNAANQCGQSEQVRLGPVPVDDSVEGVRFNYVNTSKKMANITVKFYNQDNELLETQTETIEPWKGLSSLSLGGGADFLHVIADVVFEDPVVGFEDPVVGFEVPLFLTSLETYDDTGRTGIWGTNGTGIWGTNGTGISNPANNLEKKVNKTAIAFPPLTVGPGESVQLALTNASDSAGGKAYLQLLDMESGESVIDDNFCQPIFCGKIVCDYICGPKSIPQGGKLEIEYVNNSQDATTVIPLLKDFEVPLFSESFEVPLFSESFEVPLFMPTMTLRSSDTGEVKFFSGAAGLLTPKSCQ